MESMLEVDDIWLLDRSRYSIVPHSGTVDNSPALECWDLIREYAKSVKRTAEFFHDNE